MLKVVETTMARQLPSFRKSGGAQYPSHLRIVIANFNVGYPVTQVFIPATNEVFHVALQDSSDPLCDASLKYGEYPIGPEYYRENIKALSPKIVKYGIVRKIDLDGG